MPPAAASAGTESPWTCRESAGKFPTAPSLRCVPVSYTHLDVYKRQGLGYGIVLYLAAIMGIDTEIYEAADIDGANTFQKIRVITIPCLLPTIITLTLLAVGGICKGNFQLFYNVVGNNGMLFKMTDVIDTYVYRALMQASDFGMSTAAGAYQSVLNLVIIMTVNGLTRLVDKEYALF